MSILIKGMEMPTGNDELRLIIHSNGQVIISHQTYFDETKAIPIPPHGDLIDRDALEKSLSEELLLNDKKHLESTWNDAVAVIFAAPTIIPPKEE